MDRIRKLNGSAWRWLIGVFVIATMCAAGSLRAQMMPPGFDEAMQPEFTQATARLLAAELQLTASQISAVHELQAAYDQSFKAGIREIQARLRDRAAPSNERDTPQLQRQREELQQQIAALMEEARRLQDASAEGEDTADAANEIRQRTRELTDRMKALSAVASSPAQVKAMFDAATLEIEKWWVERGRLAEQFVIGLKSVLGEAQITAWPALERRLMRERTLGQGVLAGESVDLFALIRELELDLEADSTAQTLLTEYGQKLDLALRARNYFAISVQAAISLATQEKSPEIARPSLRRQIELRTSVRDLNEQYATILGASLPEAAGTEFRLLYRQRGFSTIYRSSHTQRIFRVALERAGDDVKLREAVGAMETAFRSELEPLQEQIRLSMLVHEPQDLLHKSEARLSGDSGALEPVEHDLTTLNRRRGELDRRYLQQLSAIIPPEWAAEFRGVAQPTTEP